MNKTTRSRRRAATPTPENLEPNSRLSDLYEQIEWLHGQLQSHCVRLRALTAGVNRKRHWGVAESGPLGYVALDLKGKILECNLTLCHILGKERIEVLGWPFNALVVPSEQSKFLDYLKRCRFETFDDYVTTELRLQGRSREFPAQLLTNQGVGENGRLFLRTTVIDRTAESEMERALRSSERRLAAAVEASGAGVFEHEAPFGKNLYLSDRWAALLGYRRGDIPGGRKFVTWIRKRCHPEDLPRLAALYRELKRGRERYEIEARMRHRSGRWIWVKMWGQRAGEPGGGGASEDDDERDRRIFMGVMMDVTADRRKSVEVERRSRQLRRLTAELLDVEERERRQIASDLHDDLAQIIVATSMKLTGLHREATSDAVRDGVQEALHLLERADQSMRSLIFQVSPPVLEEVGLVPALEWLGRELGTQFGLEITIRSDVDVPRVALPIRFMLFRSVRELLINVAKHAGTREARVELSWSEERTLRITVSDSGEGFDPGEVKEESQAGFGLFSMEARLESMGGALELDSGPGKGTTVSLVVPLARDDGDDASKARTSVELPATLAAPRAKGDRLRVLLVDDHELVRLAMAQMVASQPDVEVIGEASDGESALALAGRLKPDVVLMDVTMPGMGGIESTRRLTVERPNIRVIGLSMHESDEVEKAMRDAGAAAYLRKSDSAERLLSTIREVVSGTAAVQ